MSVDELLKWEEDRRNYIKIQKEKLQEIVDLKNKELEEKREKEKLEKEKIEKENMEKRLQEMRKKEEQKKQKQEKWIKEREKWVKKHGSQYLKDGLELGYDMTKIYIEERASREMPEYEIDFNDKCRWESIKYPSEEAVNVVKTLEEKGYDAIIVTLTKSTRYRDAEEYYGYDDEFEECEAIIIRNYLDKYNLFRIIA